MLKKLICLFITILTYQVPFAYATTDHSIKQSFICDPQLQPYLNKILKVPEGRKLLEDIQKEGPLRIVSARNNHLSNQFGACWNMDLRIIIVNPSSFQSEGEMIGSIIFELHNALNNSKLIKLNNLASLSQVDKKTYVEGMERIEYENSLSAASIADKGIQLGLFPRSARLPTYPTFEVHLRIQKMGGHTAWFANTYDELSGNRRRNLIQYPG